MADTMPDLGRSAIIQRATEELDDDVAWGEGRFGKATAEDVQRLADLVVSRYAARGITITFHIDEEGTVFFV